MTLSSMISTRNQLAQTHQWIILGCWSKMEYAFNLLLMAHIINNISAAKPQTSNSHRIWTIPLTGKTWAHLSKKCRQHTGKLPSKSTRMTSIGVFNPSNNPSQVSITPIYPPATTASAKCKCTNARVHSTFHAPKKLVLGVLNQN
jgi:hypothetical protein